MRVHVIASGKTDNYFYLLSSDDGSDGLLIDPIDPDAALAALEAHGVDLRYVVNTHGHPDHTGGNAAVVAATGAPVYVHAGDAGWLSSYDELLAGGDTLAVGDVSLDVLETPGHTPGHISLYTPGHLFCGDTIFVGGAGNCRFGGDPAALFRTFRDVLASLPGTTTIYPGHDYARTNLAFAASLEPENAAREKKLASLDGGRGHTLATLDEERAYNPFLRTADADFVEILRAHRPELVGDDPEATFVALRRARDQW